MNIDKRIKETNGLFYCIKLETHKCRFSVMEK